tara:strand:- start:2138 stop:2392 length:255 start_codon:yes stop_codon:yes gene_type:complete
MIDQIKFISILEEVKGLLEADTNIGAIDKIDKSIKKYQLEIEEFERWADGMSESDANLKSTEHTNSYDSSILAHPGSFPDEKSE